MEEQLVQEGIKLMINGVPNLDQWLILFIKNNWMTATAALGVLKIIAVDAKWATGNKIIELLTGFLPKKKTQDK